MILISMKFLWMAVASVSALLVVHLTSFFVSSFPKSSPLGRTSSSTKSAATALPSSLLKRVHILVCTEALCPDCQEFLQHEIKHAIQLFGSDEYQDVFDLQIVPFGNAKLQQQQQQQQQQHSTHPKITCQHGQRECDANSWEQCALHVYPQIEQHLPFVQCLYRILPMGGHHEDVLDPALFEGCALQAQLDYEMLKACRHDLGWELQQQAAAATPSYHDHVPWIEINHEHFHEDSQDFVQEICKAYVANGGSHPVCQQRTRQS